VKNEQQTANEAYTGAWKARGKVGTGEARGVVEGDEGDYDASMRWWLFGHVEGWWGVGGMEVWRRGL